MAQETAPAAGRADDTARTASSAPTALADLDELAGSIRLSIFRLARIMRQQDRHNLSPSLTAALLVLGRHGPLSLSELAAAERVTAPTASKLVDKLEALGSVVRVPDASDRRVSRITVTEKGRAQIADIRTQRTEYLRRTFEHLPTEVRGSLPELAELLETLVDHAREADR